MKYSCAWKTTIMRQEAKFNSMIKNLTMSNTVENKNYPFSNVESLFYVVTEIDRLKMLLSLKTATLGSI